MAQNDGEILQPSSDFRSRISNNRRRGQQHALHGYQNIKEKTDGGSLSRRHRVYVHIVPGGHRAVLFDRFRGVIPTPSGEGTHFLIPWVQRPIIYDCRATPRNVPVETGSKDLQTIAITLRILFRPKPEELPTIYQNLGQDYAERLLPSITTETLKAVVVRVRGAWGRGSLNVIFAIRTLN